MKKKRRRRKKVTTTTMMSRLFLGDVKQLTEYGEKQIIWVGLVRLGDNSFCKIGGSFWCTEGTKSGMGLDEYN